jgi:hypothetical protein
VSYVAAFDVFMADTPNGRRLLGYLSPHLCKASIFSKTPNWVLGFHGCEHPARVLAMPMAHIRFLYWDKSSQRLRDRVAVHQSMSPEERNAGIAAQWGDGDAEYRSFYRFAASLARAETPIRRFTPIDSTAMFQGNVNPGETAGNSMLYRPNGYSPAADCLFDLSEQFPALLDQGGIS